jgi:hypothetical protein
VFGWPDPNTGFDQHLVREILAERPFDHQKGSRQIGTVWQTIVDNLNSKTEISFNLTSIRSVRERYGLIESKYNKIVSNELKQSGINTEPTEFDLAMEDIVSQFESQEETALKAKEAKEAEYVKSKTEAEEIRRTAMETCHETKKRERANERESDEEEANSSSGVCRSARKRKSSVMDYLLKTTECDKEIKQQELEIKRMEIQVRKQELEAQKKRDQSMLQALTNSTGQKGLSKEYCICIYIYILYFLCSCIFNIKSSAFKNEITEGIHIDSHEISSRDVVLYFCFIYNLYI